MVGYYLIDLQKSNRLWNLSSGEKPLLAKLLQTLIK